MRCRRHNARPSRWRCSLAEPGAPPPPHTIAAAVLSCLRELARQGPVLVAVDDAQWLDAHPQRRSSSPCADRAGRPRSLSLQLADGRERTLPAGNVRLGPPQRVLVGPLSLGALHRVVTAHLGHALPRPVLTRVHVVSGGNPFFALELARVAEQRVACSGRLELPLPASLGETLRERLDAVPADDTRARCSTVAAPLDADARPAGEGARVETRARGSSRRSTRECSCWRTTGDPVLAPLDRRGGVRRGVARATTRVPSQRSPRSCTTPTSSVRHLALASEGHDSDLAVALEDAAQRARLRGAPEAAATFGEQSWRATPPDESDNAWRRGVLAAEYHLHSGDMQHFRELAEGLLAASRPGDERSMACSMLSIEPVGDETAGDWLDRALDEAETTPSAPIRRIGLRDRGDDRWRSRRRESVTPARLFASPRSSASRGRLRTRSAWWLGTSSCSASGCAAISSSAWTRCTSFSQTDRLEDTVDIDPDDGGRRRACWRRRTSSPRREAARRRCSRAARTARLSSSLSRRSSGSGRSSNAWRVTGSSPPTSPSDGDELAEQTGQRRDPRRSPVPAGHSWPRTAATSTRHAHSPRRASPPPRAGTTIGTSFGISPSSGFSSSRCGISPERRATSSAPRRSRPQPGTSSRTGCDSTTTSERRSSASVDSTKRRRWSRGSTSAGAPASYPWTLATAARCRGQLLAEHGRGRRRRSSVAGGPRGRAASSATRSSSVGRTSSWGAPSAAPASGCRRGRPSTRRFARFEESGAALWAQTARSELGRISGRRVGDPDELTEGEQRIAELVAEGRSNKEVAADAPPQREDGRGDAHPGVSQARRSLARELAARFAGGSNH